MNISSIKHLYAFQDGDTITPGMGIRIDAGYGLHQYWNPTTKKVTATDFSQHPATLYPQAYSSKKGDIIVPETAGQQWYYNNISEEGAILENGVVKQKFTSLFQISTVSANGKVFPALIIKGNLATDTDHTDKYIYYSSSYAGKTFTCQQLIPIQAAVGEAYDVLLSMEGADGNGDNVLSNDQDWVKVLAILQLAGQSVSKGVTYKFQKLSGKTWIDLSTIKDYQEVGTDYIKIFNYAVEGVEIFRVVATYNNKEYYKTFEITDVHDPYYIDDGCNIAGDAVMQGQKATFSPKVYNRADGSISTGWTFDYMLTSRSAGDVITDIDETKLTYENIDKYGGINVRIEATKENA